MKAHLEGRKFFARVRRGGRNFLVDELHVAIVRENASRRRRRRGRFLHASLQKRDGLIADFANANLVQHFRVARVSVLSHVFSKTNDHVDRVVPCSGFEGEL